MKESSRVLEEFQVPYELVVSSAHRAPARTQAYARSAAGRGLRVLIAAAGGAAHLAGTLAASTTLPVIGVPIGSSPLGGIDALLSTVQMPGGVPVATMAVGKWGARNAGILAIQILALSAPPLACRLQAFKSSMAAAFEGRGKAR
ncbi:MAG: 5-(carboxyamino)imidazole ribonucleotide mutase [Deltaproteobacteria bacterium]|nr:5-(carboxyamino)imidazole ribonucleotide mutase [Deltaproteobacteria bacterium]